ncbi:DDE-type integrase/transposase/recombinase [Brevibacterium sp. CS2]|uniref:DDE-type integrase/transposase/recombinase n=1 Tax=Brevibacterium sp. CS2 TaxID=2575923 RepID=UPI0010C79BAC|nr:DDE-type integrase/transposase/recombinase [Brevibacterium sp. CS2]QCP05611.1 transposase family protein [Brevibacterium sp. CS2]
MTDWDVSMTTRIEVTKKYATAYVRASKKQKGAILDTVVGITGWDRDHARQQLRRRAAQPPGRPIATVAVLDRRKSKPRRYSYDAVVVLQRIWAASGGLCGKYLAASMGEWIEAMERHGALLDGEDRYCPSVRAELLAMSAATIDRYLAPTRAKDPLHGKSATKPGSLLRTSITIRKAGDEVEAEPGFFEVDTVAHCGPTLTGEFARSVNLTDVRIGWVFTRAIRNNARVHILATLQAGLEAIPYLVSGLDFDNGSEFINHDVVNWAADQDIFFTRSRPYKKNDQATIESKNGHLVRRYGFHYRYDTGEELALLNRLWPLINDRLNFLTPTKKPTGWSTDAVGRRKRLYDTPQTPYRRLLASGILSNAQQTELKAHHDRLDPMAIATEIDRIQQQLIRLAAERTRQLEREAQASTAPPNPAGIKLHHHRRQPGFRVIPCF